MKTRKTTLERLKAFQKKHGGYSVCIKLSEMLWRYMVDFVTYENSDGIIYTTAKRVRVPRFAHIYRLKSARGEWTVKQSIDVKGLWYIRKRGTIYPRETGHPLVTFGKLYAYDRAKTMSGAVYGRYLNGGASI